MAREQDRQLTDEQRAEYNRSLDEFREHKRQKHNQMVALQSLPYEVKVGKAKQRIREFIYGCEQLGYNTHVSVGGLDSITLLCLIRSMNIDIPAVSVSVLEDKSIIRVHKQLGVTMLKPLKAKHEILQEEGFPVISKKIATKIMALQDPTEGNATIRHAIITGECGEKGHFATNSAMQLPKRWLELFGGYENENEGTNYKVPPFKVSSKCCEIMKERPCDIWAKENNSKPFLGLMASEGGRRQEALEEHGCNYFGKTTIRSAPFAPFLRQDLLQLALDLNVPIPEIYGRIESGPNGELYTTGAQRTGCEMCGFGVHMEKRPHRFDKLYDRNPKAWDYWMNKCCTDKDGNKYGWGLVLDYIGVEWRQQGRQMILSEYMDKLREATP
ncbi:MAG: hypothetical protein U0K87_05005 [Ruminococcus sp.]|nr:hypothetical protein [Ruminococcus sp.]